MQCASIHLKAREYQPFSGIFRVHGKEMGVMACWYTNADRLPVDNITRCPIRENFKCSYFPLNTVKTRIHKATYQSRARSDIL